MATAKTGRSDQMNCCRKEPTGSGHAQVQSSCCIGGGRPVSCGGRFRRERTGGGS